MTTEEFLAAAADQSVVSADTAVSLIVARERHDQGAVRACIACEGEIERSRVKLGRARCYACQVAEDRRRALINWRTY